jgi:hypothetical protein
MSPETIDLVQKGGVLVFALLVIGWLLLDRNRLLDSLSDKDKVIAAKDAIIAAKDDKLAALSEKCITTMTEFKVLLQSVVDIFNTTKRR